MNANKLMSRTENNPAVMNPLAHRLGLSKDLAFHDLFSIDDEDMLSLIPRPAVALLVLSPESELHSKARQSEDANALDYDGSGSGEPIMFFKQTIRNACGLIGCIHAISNGPARDFILKGSQIDKLLEEAVDLKPTERARLIHDSDGLEAAHTACAALGDSTVPDAESWEDKHGFVAFVRGNDGHVWELNGSRKRPVDRGPLDENDDALSPGFLNRSIRPFLEREKQADSSIEFSITVLASGYGD
ncbi:MAG: hypothetical protein Q9227_003465 [Pyrenula ochraceoflavens]